MYKKLSTEKVDIIQKIADAIMADGTVVDEEYVREYLDREVIKDIIEEIINRIKEAGYEVKK
jgi:mannitol/fructose-specific phosphotransferase system IIA component